MKHIVWKAYWNFEKEEKWLNEMSAKGLALHSYSWCRYVFEESTRGEYIYRIELLDQLASHPESQAYIRFIEETGIECVATYLRWVYFRKNASEGAFNLYSDYDSRIAHYQRVNIFWITFMILELIAGVSNIGIGIINILNYEQSYINLVLGIIVSIFGVAFYFFGRPLRKKIKQLRHEKTIHE